MANNKGEVKNKNGAVRFGVKDWIVFVGCVATSISWLSLEKYVGSGPWKDPIFTLMSYTASRELAHAIILTMLSWIFLFPIFLIGFTVVYHQSGGNRVLKGIWILTSATGYLCLLLFPSAHFTGMFYLLSIQQFAIATIGSAAVSLFFLYSDSLKPETLSIKNSVILFLLSTYTYIASMGASILQSI